MAQQFDLFVSNEPAFAKPAGLSATKRLASIALSEDEMVRQLQATGRYRILKKLEPRPVTTAARPEFPLKGIILDTETTGLNHRKDEIIEIGAVAFTFDETGNIGDITGVYGGLQQPTSPIPAEITRLTGITDEMVTGHMIDTAQLRALVEPADLVIAHNAGFDRPFCEAFSPIFVGKAWACSVSEIDWPSRGFEGTKLGYLIGQAGYFHEGHRAVDDCFALLEVLAQGDGVVGDTPFAELYTASQQSRVRVFAENSPFDMKDHLKARGYRWADGSDGRPKSWWIEIAEDALDNELRYLRSEIYHWDEADPPIKRLTAFDRFRA
ncbi:3'-5' exonuclease [Sinorhizobium mexicanum]|uniref:3'-5' exonuclease n=1 Tax=Sinorhizobium mexicanum TaxID=375549 RepID=A0A859R2U7_9HYPH|nr:3'-5' exonuclease [Sinorhizobium mexicanum]MBP1886451.1 DNA polymerase-3 subunit epsilon [Sinorhizobium mexicanum]QLL63968.1 3'-5' exonuclease [Sinorhizobium mexicanum]